MLIDDHRPSTRPSTPQGNMLRRWSSQTSSFLAPLVLRNRRLCSAMRARPPPVESPTAPLVKADEAEWKKRLPADMLHLSVRLSELESRFETLLLVSIVADDTGTWQ